MTVSAEPAAISYNPSGLTASADVNFVVDARDVLFVLLAIAKVFVIIDFRELVAVDAAVFAVATARASEGLHEPIEGSSNEGDDANNN